MTCTIIAHTRFEDAVDLLAADLARDQSADPLAVRTLLVQGGVVGRWLSTELALRSPHGISAGLDLRPVGAFCRGLVAPVSRHDPYALESLIWIVDATMENQAWLASVPECADLCAALTHLDRAGRHALAVHVAGILDRYQLERPDWIRIWSAGATVPEAKAVPWLGALWSRIRQQAGQLAPLSTRIETLISAMNPELLSTEVCPQRLWILAPSTLPPLLIRLLAALGDQGGREVRVLHLVPAQHASMWTALDNEADDFDPETTPLDEPLAGAHPLLAAYARQSHDLGVLLAELSEGKSRTVDFDALKDLPLPGNASLLVQLQGQIGHALSGPLTRTEPDHSLIIHRCHSPLREVEVLRDALVQALTSAGGPRPDEVLIAVTDLDTYAPLLSAVLGEERGDGIFFPVRVVGQAATTDPLITALLAVLALPGSCASLEQVLAPLDAPAVRRRFGLAEGDLATLRHRLESAGISWGLDAQQRQLVSDYPHAEGTWQSGVDRLLLGLTTGPDQVVLSGQHPAGARLLGDAQAIGGVAVYLEILLRFAQAVGDGTRSVPVADWRTVLFGLLSDMTDALSGADAQAINLVRGAIAAIPRDAANPDLRTVRKHLQRMLDDEGNASTWTRGGVTVAPLAALRHAPHAFIAILGLDNSFPRARIASAFDPAADRCRRGDRSQRLDDRQTFLDLLLAARSSLHLSWTGFAAEDGSARESSATIEDLLRFFDQQLFDTAGQRLGRAAVLITHSLHGSSPVYFDGSMPRSHDRLAWAAAQARLARDAQEKAPVVAPFLTTDASAIMPVSLTPEDLVAWSIDPAKAFAENILGLRFPRHETMPDHEPIELDMLDTWSLRDKLLEGLLCGRPVDEKRMRQDGLLPHGPAGTIFLAQVLAEATAVGDTLDAALEAAGCDRKQLLSSTWPLEVLSAPDDEKALRIAGSISRCNGRVALCLHSGSLKGTHLLSGWVFHQLLNAQARQHEQKGVTTLIIGKGKEKKNKDNLLDSGLCRLSPDAGSAKDWAAIMQLVRQSWRRPQPLFPDLAAACWDWKKSQIVPNKVEEHVQAWNDGAEEDEGTFTRSELATPKSWTRLMWRGVENPTKNWDEIFLQTLWLPAVLAVQGMTHKVTP